MRGYLLVFRKSVFSLQVLPAVTRVFLQTIENELFAGLAHVKMRRMEAEIINAHLFVVALPGVNHRSGQCVADIFDGPFIRHRLDEKIPIEEVGPVFPVMRVMADMMLANGGEIVFMAALGVNRRGIALVIFRAFPEFFRRKLCQIMMQSEEENPHMESVQQNAVAVFADGMEMLEYVIGAHSKKDNTSPLSSRMISSK